MNEELLDLVYKLKDSLAKDPRIIKLDELEDKMNNSNEVAKLAIKKEAASDDYNFAFRKQFGGFLNQRSGEHAIADK